MAFIFLTLPNGFHDAADMVATAIAPHTIDPARAIALFRLFPFSDRLLPSLPFNDTLELRIRFFPTTVSLFKDGILYTNDGSSKSDVNREFNKLIMWTNDKTIILLIIARTLIVYLTVTIRLRLMGKRESSSEEDDLVLKYSKKIKQRFDE